MTEYADPTAICATRSTSAGSAPTSAIELGDTINIEVGPLLARSAHVVYTNIVEALLRFVMVSRGRMLLHSACVELDGVGVMLSALTDTGQDRHRAAPAARPRRALPLRRHDGHRPSGNAPGFPKPLTISAHTLRACHADDLTRRVAAAAVPEPSALQGRPLAGADAGRFNLPIMGINAITQMLVPPPKYTVDRLVPCRIDRATRVKELFIIERGAPRLATWTKRDTLDAADREHRRRLRVPALPVPRAGDHHRRPGLPRAAPAASARSWPASSRTSGPGCSPRTRSAGPTRSRTCSRRVIPARPSHRATAPRTASAGPRKARA